jgi:hypothetical protein
MPSAQTIPTTLKNPNALTAGSKSYDGSSAVTLTAADFGLASAMKFIGITTTDLTTSANQSSAAITVSGSSVTATAGNVVLYGDGEYVWTGSKWELLGN